MPALVQRPAPTFRAEAVVEGSFKNVNLQDYLGQWYVKFQLTSLLGGVRLLRMYIRVVLLFYPMYAQM